MTEAFAGDWATALRRDIVDDRRVPIRATNKNYQMGRHLDDAARLFYLKSALSLAEGKGDAALDEFAMSLAIVRYRIRYGGRAGSYFEHEMLAAAETLLRRGGSESKFCRGMLALLNRHAEEMPSFSELIKGSYEATTPRSAWQISDRNGYLGPVAMLIDAPLEEIRSDRLQRAFCRGLLIADEKNVLFLRPRKFGEYGKSSSQGPVRYLALATPDRSAHDWARILSDQSLSFYTFPLFDIFAVDLERHATAVAHLNAIRLACAAALFRANHGREVGALDELAPEYFPTLPKSPFAECAFVLRRSQGETWRLVPSYYENKMLRTIAAGTGVIELACLPELKIAVPTASRGP